MKGLFIFRRDLRIVDNTALIKAHKECDKVFTIFIFTPEQVSEKNRFKSDGAVKFMIGALDALKHEIGSNGGKLTTLYGENNDVVKRCISQWNIDTVYWNKDYTPYAKRRDAMLIKMCIKLNKTTVECDDYYLNTPGSIVTGSGSSYLKYTPYKNKALTMKFDTPDTYEILKLSKSSKKIEGCEITTRDALDTFVESEQESVTSYKREAVMRILHRARVFKNYENNRNELSRETTRLSAPIKFGVVSIREVAKYFKHNHALISQLIWRDFYAQILDAHPVVLGSPLKSKYNKIKWIGTHAHFVKWCQGNTGFPIVDAGMRELNNTGYMHNRARLIVASFLIKTLLVDWQKGEKYFATKLVDYDPASNNGNWQWVASTGADSQPYFRIFNPWTQSKDHDPDALYIKKWVPELKGVSAKYIHRWDECIGADEFKDIHYPKPIVDYKEQREKALKMYNIILSK